MRSSTQGALMFFVVSGGLLGAVMFVQHRAEERRIAAVRAEESRRAAAWAASARAAEDAEQRRFTAMTDAEHLAAARVAARAADRNTTQRHLNAVGRARERDVQRVGDELAWHEIQRSQEQERDRGRAEAAGREDYARVLEDALLRSGQEVRSVRVVGTTLRVTYVLCGRVWMRQEMDPRDAELRARGFTRVECLTGYRSPGVTRDLGR